MFFKMTARRDEEQIKAAFEQYRESEHHSIFHVCLKPYSSFRTGIHSYIKKHHIMGYYESGETNRNGHLFTAKVWFFLFMKQRGGNITVKGIVFPEPMFLLSSWMIILGCAMRFMCCFSFDSVIGVLFGIGMTLVLLLKQVGEMTLLQKMVSDVLAEV